MKLYKIDLGTKFAHCFILVILIFGSYVYFKYNNQSTFGDKILFIFGILFFIYGTYSAIFLRIELDADKLEMSLPFFKINIFSKSVRWVDIIEITALYYLFPESAMLRIKSKQETGRIKMTYIPLLGSIVIPLMKDILSYIPPTAKVSLYPRLKRKLEGKQTWFYRK
jgi:hypothetical protein